MTRGIVYTASAGGLVQARGSADSVLLWQHDLKSALASGPKVRQNTVVVGGADAEVFALSTADGHPCWSKQVSNELLAPPKIARSNVYAKTIDGRVYAFTLDNGRVRWRYFHGSPQLILRAGSAVSVSGNTLVAGFSDGKIVGLEADSGQVRWTKNLAYSRGASDVERMIDIDATPIISRGVVYAVSYQGYVAALSLDDGRFLWRRKLSSYRNMSLSHNRLFVTDASSGLWAIDASNGSVLWHQKNLMYRGLTAVASSSFGLLTADKYGFLHVVSESDGEVIARTQLSIGAIYASAAVAGNQVYVLGGKGGLIKYQLSWAK